MSGSRAQPARPLRSFERWTERQVSEAIADGRFTGSDAAGKPLPGLDEPHDDLWWLRRKLQEEQLSVMPPSLRLRADVQQLLRQAAEAPTEAVLRRHVEQANTLIRRANRLGIAGPPHNLSPYDAEALVASWRTARQAAAPPPPPPDDPPAAPSPAARRRWWRRG